MDWVAIAFFVFFALGSLWTATALICARLAVRCGGGTGKWVFLGFLLGPFGIWLTLRLTRSCPNCQGGVFRDVVNCPHCGSEIPRIAPEENPAGPLWTYRRDW
ncbi:MAG: hypothetical protein VX733_07185 [Candidatus Latescibacterota bacterium]|nr:hypothetical protein [Candidatus Latescibacterota bacterium]